MRSKSSRVKLIGGAVLILFGLAWLGLLSNAGYLFGSYKRLPEVTVYLRDDVTPAQMGEITEKLSQLSEVDSWRYQSKEAATEEYKRIFADKPTLVKNLEPGVLPASFDVHLTRPGDLGEVAATLEGQAGVDVVQSGGEALRRVVGVMSAIRIALMIAAGAAICAGVFLIGGAYPGRPGAMGLGGAAA